MGNSLTRADNKYTTKEDDLDPMEQLRTELKTVNYEQEKLRMQLDVLASNYQLLLNNTGKLIELSAVLTVKLRRLEVNRVMVAEEVDNI
jgi:hypothetical protein